MESSPINIAGIKTNPQNSQLKGRDIVIISLQPWYYDIGSNCKTIAKLLAEHNRVLYINKPINRKTLFSQKKDAGILNHYKIIKRKGNTLRKISNNMWQLYPASIIESINWLPSTSLFKKCNFINNHRFAKDIKHALKNLGFKNIILFNDNDIYNGYYLKKLLSPSAYIYYCRDFLTGYNYWKKHCKVLEPQLIKSSDIVVTNSSYYASYCSNYNSSSHYIGQGCNLQLFNPDKLHEVPDDIKNIKYPIAGYAGALDSDRLDESIIENIAVNCSQINIVLVGPEDEKFEKSSLHTLKNVHFLGKKSLQQLPAYLQAFDVCINPQLKNEITRGNYPLKIDEYLAMGKPVVATRTEAMEMFEDFTYLGDSPLQFSALVNKALAENNETLEERRKSFAQSHTWENSMNKLYKVILTHLKN
jgi:glycosyltransferase involved in cell wall biosynthesis